MPQRTIRLLATLRDIVGGKEISVALDNNITVREFISIIEETHPELGDQILDENGELTGQVHVFINGRNVMWLDHLDTRITPEDEVLLVPPVAGG